MLDPSVRHQGREDGRRAPAEVLGFVSGVRCMVVVTDWQRDFGLPADLIKGGAPTSGMPIAAATAATSSAAAR